MQPTTIDATIGRIRKAIALMVFAAASLPGTGFAATDAALLPQDLSPWRMFMDADIVVKVVMIGLAFASLVTWTVWLAKSVEIWRKQRPQRKEALARKRRSLDDAAREFTKEKTPWRVSCAPRRVKSSFSQRFRRRREGAHRLQIERVEDAMRAVSARHRHTRNYRLDRALCRPFWHRVGHHEHLHRHLQGAHHQSCGRRSRHRRSIARDRARPCRRDPGGRDLQSPRPLDRGLSRDAR